jgi:hypothetical protein
MIAHVALTIEFVARVQKIAIVTPPDQTLQFFDRKPAAEIDFFESRAVFAKETLRFATGGSGGFEVELHSL